MEHRKGLTTNGITTPNFIFILTALAMIGVGIYLTTHFYDTLYPTRLGGPKSLCDVSNFFNCDTATYSPLSNVAGVPISFFGIIVGLLFLFSSLMPSEALERTSSVVSKVNFLGCVVLFVYSLVALGSLCPFCTVYYVLSGIAAFLIHRYGIRSWAPDARVTVAWGIILAVGSFLMFQNTRAKEDTKNKINTSIVEQFRKLPSLGDPDQESPYKIHLATEKFADSPIRISVFSDFQCPFCKVVAQQLPELVRRYPKAVSIQYFFYPLDHKCNSNVKSGFHEHACDAAQLAACDEKKFLEVHDEIFEGQDRLNTQLLRDLAASHGLEKCFEDPEAKNRVIAGINQSTKFNLKSTPTIIVNGKKIEGTIPSNQFFAIFDDILRGQK